ncbi:hypothetical protein FGD67_06310 [Colwellia sp. M166]|jgi:hypothetical protein|uniref:hypothetical protein n=1 Tax=Colwellia sp. M166 TaxID=2583805 RepID=UPI00211DBF8A|nr:hypothetical protein [Colwellia sp. M166]UUO22843.1 hypothetical protein FGD67_06310 [Colwellia sp. M166]
MSKIAEFRQRQLKIAAENAKKANQAPVNPALALLAQLLNVPEENAIVTAQKYIDENISFFAADIAKGEDVTMTAKVETNDQGEITKISDVDELNAVKDDIENSADNVNESAANVDQAADNVSLAASDLAYTADDINNATETLKEATTELKKPSAARKSSSSKKAKKPKSSSKK